MRKTLDFLYDSAAALAALFMVGLLAVVLLSIIGRRLYFNIPGIDAYAGYLMAGTGFLALARTLKRGEAYPRHADRLAARAGRAPLAGTLGLRRRGAAGGAVRHFYSVRLAWHSHGYNDISTGNDATPLWLPQLGMAVGAVVLAIAAVDEFFVEWSGRPLQANAEALRHE